MREDCAPYVLLSSLVSATISQLSASAFEGTSLWYCTTRVESPRRMTEEKGSSPSTAMDVRFSIKCTTVTTLLGGIVTLLAPLCVLLHWFTIDNVIYLYGFGLQMRCHSDAIDCHIMDDSTYYRGSLEASNGADSLGQTSAVSMTFSILAWLFNFPSLFYSCCTCCGIRVRMLVGLVSTASSGLLFFIAVVVTTTSLNDRTGGGIQLGPAWGVAFVCTFACMAGAATHVFMLRKHRLAAVEAVSSPSLPLSHPSLPFVPPTHNYPSSPPLTMESS
mmetsp:Transcript_22247/g.72106  ORF Transcript_22247/g.72106 Transcript_22247/m.72106 type:complete len:275 (-) Transcript_22247:62-886(-)